MNNPWRLQPGLLDFLSFSPSGSIASKLMRGDSVRLVLDYMITMREDGAKGSPFHSDMMHISDDSPEVSFWYSLSKVTVERGGGIAVIPNNPQVENIEKQARQKMLFSNNNSSEVPRIVYNTRLAGTNAIFKPPDYLCSGRPRWEWY
ncbi:hypothetical protein TrLO_g798 [Triparma laevis f. longispina]|uniref:Phytanoyl-CoA dioxygenase n=1 Tax=Triparma laevis f. longispina TaxID=1714387 RepID=A0A9W7DWG8_9STRA|nr:hypothetical protein TrLO_g798 [Triparma laevis f. longispina]